MLSDNHRMNSEIAEILRCANNRDDIPLKLAIEGFVKQFPSKLEDLVNKFLSDEFSSQAARAALTQFAIVIKSLPAEAFEPIGNFALEKIKSSANNFDEADFIIRDGLFSVFLAWGQYSEAAQALAGVNVDSTTRPYSETEKADIFVKCAEAFLADDASVDAEVFVNKARVPMDVVTEWTLKLRYKVVLARILDANRKFTEAAKQYYELSTSTNENLNQDDLLELYVKSITCNILGKTGPQRTRNLGLLFKDSRFETLHLTERYSSHPILLEKMYKEQIVRKDDIAAFESYLMEHQRATMSDGFSYLEKAVIEHNMLAIGKIYENIRLTELATVLMIDERRAEKLAAAMITEHRLHGYIDQSANALIFLQELNSHGILDSEILAVCESVAQLADSVLEKNENKIKYPIITACK